MGPITDRIKDGRMMPDTSDSDSPFRPAAAGHPAGEQDSAGSQWMTPMKDEAITRFRRDSRPAFHGQAPHDEEGLPALSLQHVTALHRLYDPILHEPVPGRMLDLLRRYDTPPGKDDHGGGEEPQPSRPADHKWDHGWGDGRGDDTPHTEFPFKSN